jgi:hypothetical protein
MTAVPLLARLMLFAVMAAILVGCGKVRAQTEPVVALNVPSPPERVAIPVQIPEPEAPPADPAPPATTSTAPPRGQRPDTTARADRPAAAQPTVITPVEAPPPPPVLQTTTNIGALEQKTTALLAEAQRNLDKVNYKDLGVQARAQYDRAVGFIKNAHNALAIKNYNYAEQLADKAASLAKELVKG